MNDKLLVAVGLGALLLTGGIAFAGGQAGDMTRAEAAARAREDFARLDVNKDAKLDAADRSAHHSQMAAALFDRVDADRNGSISRDEWNAGAARLAQADPRGDTPAHMLRMHRPAMRLMRADQNGDRAITAREFEREALERFERADADRNGVLTPGERQAARGLTRPLMTRD